MYDARTQSYWSVAAQLSPWCIVQPSNTTEVSLSLITLLADPQCGIAVRSGGHTTFAGANNIEDGVTIDLGNMNTTTYHAGNSTASIQPGSRWLQVYQTLDALGVTVPGGRAGTVGVAGLILGGGNSFYSAKKGMVCDNVVGYEMVTYTGDVLYVTADTYPDLFKALKGGGSNFGIVTRFEMIAFESPKLWGGVVTYNASAGAELLDSMVAFVDNVENDQGSSSIIFWSYQPALRDTIVITAYENTDGVVAGSSFDKYLAIPGNLTSTMRLTNISDLTHELEQPTGYM
jgi:FAD/FMN-containing dehydrogenase